MSFLTILNCFLLISKIQGFIVLSKLLFWCLKDILNQNWSFNTSDSSKENFMCSWLLESEEFLISSFRSAVCQLHLDSRKYSIKSSVHCTLLFFWIKLVDTSDH